MTLRRWFFAALLCCAGLPAHAATYYVRTDGGTTAQCTGTVDAPYPGSGSAQPCAFHHPFDALAPQESGSQNPAIVLHGGDTLIIDSGTYEMGLNAPDARATYPACNPAFSYDCHIPPIPSGTGSHTPSVVERSRHALSPA